MKQDIFFMPLGGGQRVGASCYYLRIAEQNIILDAGVGKENKIEFEPNFHSLLTSPFVQSMNQINQIFVSHAHIDHIGYLLNLMKQTNHANVYMTELTKVFAEFQLYDKLLSEQKLTDENKRLAIKSLLEKIATVSYMQTIDFGKYKVTFYPAGHIPGAMMLLFEVGKRKILYTGDYSLHHTILTSGCMIPNDICIDTVIMCGLHAKHPNYKKRTDMLFDNVMNVLHSVESTGKSILCHISQLSKGIEFLKALNDCNTSKIPIYLDNSIVSIVKKMEQLSIPILNETNKIVGEILPKEPHIYITSNTSDIRTFFYNNEIKIDFSLHEDFSEMKQFIKKINPKQTVLVHCGKENSVLDRTIEQEVMLDGECRTQFIFAEETELYKL